ncbi:YoaK family protein [Brevundimonas sp.]|uniref:YoaK family protein n=1 Tax=Brevundimonas sp. TaxID=1871086 RepID=UPI00289DE670|nr:YoaK family protein [Brevundimonas sp.]
MSSTQSRVVVPADLLIALSFGTGATDAFAFLALQGVFSANMTGNLVLVGLYDRPGYREILAGSAFAVLAFAAALWAAFALTRRFSAYRAGLSCLAATTLFQAAVAGFWIWSAARPGHAETFGLIALSCIAMASQTAGVRRLGADRSISTTFATGTLTGLVQDLADGIGGERRLRLLIIAALPLGALAGAACMDAAPAAAPLIPALLIIGVVARLVGFTSRQRSASRICGT